MSDLVRPCGCCEPGEGWAAHQNRAGLTQFSYRFADYWSFFEHMLDDLHRSAVTDPDGTVRYPLETLTTRSTEDPMIAVLDSAAVVSDILTFYQERIANEGFLRTATERLSVLELARAIGYELHPGVSASTHLAFELDASEPHRSTIPAGVKVDSLPSGGQLPQTFETTTPAPARSDWNEIKPLATVPQGIGLVSGELKHFSFATAFGTGGTAVAPSQVFTVSGPTPTGTVWIQSLEVLRLAGKATGVTKGDRLLFVGSQGASLSAAVLKVSKVVPDSDLDVTDIHLEANPVPPAPSVIITPATHQAVPSVLPELGDAAVASWIANRRWRDPDLESFLTAAEWDGDLVRRHLMAATSASGSSQTGVFRFKNTAAVFGHNAPLHSSLPVVTSSGDISVQFRGGSDPFATSWDGTNGWSVFNRYPNNTAWPNGGIRLARKVQDVAADSWCVIEEQRSGTTEVEVRRITDVWEESVTGFSLTGEVSALKLGWSLTSYFGPRVRTASVHVGSEALEIAELPLTAVLEHPVAGGADLITLDGFYPGLRADSPVTVTGLDTDLDGIERAEVASIDRVEHHFGRTVLFLTAALTYRYIRTSVTINANTVKANHGTTTSAEVLGSGRASDVHQSFVLGNTRADHLTHIAANTPLGIEPSLEVRVNGVRWTLVDALFGHGPTDQVYEVRIDDNGEARVQFGDGITGSRLPTGDDNITATYRTGIGSKGELDADALTLLPARPEWVSSVTNPEPASGAQDPEDLDDARSNAPLTVRTLDRIVSPSDYQDFARSYAGIGKARADRLWDGRGELMVVTVGSSTGVALDADSTALTCVAGSIETYRDPVRPVRVVPLTERTFDLSAKVLVDDRFDIAVVVADVDRRLRDAYAYRKRNLAEDVTKSSVLATMHGAAGVVAVDLDLLAPTGTSGVAGFVDALPARWVNDDIQSAQLLLLNPFGLKLTGVEVT